MSSIDGKKAWWPALAPLATAVFLALMPSATGTARAEDLQRPSKLIRTPLGNLLVAEVGPPARLTSSRVSIVDAAGNRRTLLGGLPSAINAVNSPTGASALYLSGRTLFVAIGEGDV